MPFHGECEFLNETLKSLSQQSCRNIEFIFVADRASETAMQAVAEFLRGEQGELLSSPSDGIVSALNHGLFKSRGEYIARLDSDDCIIANRFEKQFNAFKRDGSLVIVGSNIELIDANSNLIGTKRFPMNDSKIREYMKYSNPFAHPAVLFSREAALSVGGYAEEYPGAEDYELWTRLMKIGNGLNLRENLTRYRVHPAQVTSKHAESSVIVGGFISLRLAGGISHGQPVTKTFDDLIQLSKSRQLNRKQLAIASLILSRNLDSLLPLRFLLLLQALLLSPRPFLFFAKLRLLRLVSRFFGQVVNTKRR